VLDADALAVDVLEPDDVLDPVDVRDEVLVVEGVLEGEAPIERVLVAVAVTLSVAVAVPVAVLEPVLVAVPVAVLVGDFEGVLDGVVDAPASSTLTLTFRYTCFVMATAAHAETLPAPAAGAVHEPVKLVLAALDGCVSAPAHADCALALAPGVRVPTPKWAEHDATLAVGHTPISTPRKDAPDDRAIV